MSNLWHLERPFNKDNVFRSNITYNFSIRGKHSQYTSDARAIKMKSMLKSIFLARVEKAFKLWLVGELTSECGILVTQAVLRFEYLLVVLLKKQLHRAFGCLAYKSSVRETETCGSRRANKLNVPSEKIQATLQLVSAVTKSQFVPLDKMRAVRKWQLLLLRYDLQNLKKESYHNLHHLKLATFHNLCTIISQRQQQLIAPSFHRLRTTAKSTSWSVKESKVLALSPLLQKIALYEEPASQKYVLGKRFLDALKVIHTDDLNYSKKHYTASVTLLKFLRRRISHSLKQFWRQTRPRTFCFPILFLTITSCTNGPQ